MLSLPIHCEDVWSTKTGNVGDSMVSVVVRSMGSSSKKAKMAKVPKRNNARSHEGTGRSSPQP